MEHTKRRASGQRELLNRYVSSRVHVVHTDDPPSIGSTPDLPPDLADSGLSRLVFSAVLGPIPLHDARDVDWSRVIAIGIELTGG